MPSERSEETSWGVHSSPEVHLQHSLLDLPIQSLLSIAEEFSPSIIFSNQMCCTRREITATKHIFAGMLRCKEGISFPSPFFYTLRWSFSSRKLGYQNVLEDSGTSVDKSQPPSLEAPSQVFCAQSYEGYAPDCKQFPPRDSTWWDGKLMGSAVRQPLALNPTCTCDPWHLDICSMSLSPFSSL